VSLEVADIQGLITSGYGRLRAASYLLFRVEDAPRARRWLGGLAERLTTAAAPVTTAGVNVAFTSTGLERLGVATETLNSFPAEFLEGMATPHRSRVLGDVGPSAPRRWRWGGGDQGHVDAVLMLFARDQALLSDLRGTFGAGREAGLETVAELSTSDLGNREHFGFNDGISQPVIDGQGRPGVWRDVVQPGEFVLGYANEYGLYPPAPTVPETDDPKAILSPAHQVPGARDLGRNGTYLVFRQLRQDVAGFWNFAAERAADSGQGSAERLAAKMVGRWTSGAPLVKAPDRDDPELATFNDFAYHREDAEGLRCAVGAHIRRANPRDSLDPAPGSDRSVSLVKRHRILRRGREYGPPLSSDPAGPRPPLTDDGQERGLHFICLNANLVRQFEFVQGTWLASPKFAGLYDDADPLVAARAQTGATLTIPGSPFRHRVGPLPQFVTVVGGGYFFLPGIRAARYIGSI
jgi:Dyp-type peroxidase family